MTCGECVYFKERPSLSKPPIVQIGDCICPSPNIPAFIIKRCPIYGFIDATDCPHATRNVTKNPATRKKVRGKE